jgi:cyclic-di-GMP-binding protein
MMAAKDASFDIVSEFDRQELMNALDQCKREIVTRFDLKDSGSELVLNKEDITITTDSDFTLRNILQILEDKLIKRNLSPFLLDTQSHAVETALGGKVRQVVALKNGINQETAKKIVAEVKQLKLKVQASIQGDQVRVSGKSRDELQAVIAHIKNKGAEWELPLQFENFR